MPEQARVLAAISRATRQMNSAANRSVIMRTLVEAALELVNAEAGTWGYCISESEMRFAEYRFGDGRWQDIDLIFRRGGPGIPAYIMEARRPYFSNDMPSDPYVRQDLVKLLGFHNLIDLPLFGRDGELLGCFELHNKRGHEPFNEEDVQRLEVLAEIAAVALENALLDDARQRQLAELHDAEQRLRRSEELSRSILTSSSDCIKIVSLDGKLEYFAPSACEVLECPDLSTLLGQYWPNFFEGEHRVAQLAAIDAAKRGQTGRFQGFCRTVAGTPKWWDVVITPMFGSDGRVERLLATSRDITPLHEAEEELRRNEGMLRLAQQTAGAATWEWDIPGDRLVWARGSADIFARPLETLKDHPTVMECVYADDRAALLNDLTRALQSGSEFSVEFRAPSRDGTIRWILCKGEVLRDATGAAVKMSGISIDITARKQIEEALRRKDEALRKSEKLAAAGRLAATIAHEINNPLEAVTNLLFLLRTNVKPEGEIFLSAAEGELQRVASITRQTLGFYREAAAPVAVDLPRVIEEGLAIFDGKLSARRIEIVRQLEPCEVIAVRGEIRQVIVNLISNALDAMEDGGVLRLVTRPVSGGAEVVVSDTGPGISEENLPHLFDAFFTTKNHVGTGLGLWVAKEIVEKHGGTIQVESRRGAEHGATFTIVLKNLTSAAAKAA